MKKVLKVVAALACVAAVVGAVVYFVTKDNSSDEDFDDFDDDDFDDDDFWYKVLKYMFWNISYTFLHIFEISKWIIGIY